MKTKVVYWIQFGTHFIRKVHRRKGVTYGFMKRLYFESKFPVPHKLYRKCGIVGPEDVTPLNGRTPGKERLRSMRGL